MSYKIVTSPSTEPITLTQAKLFCGVDGADEDDLITTIIKSARWTVENYLGYKLITTGMEMYLNDLPTEFEIFGLVQSITSVKYYDADDALQTLDDSNYDTDIISKPAIIKMSSTGTYPSVYTKLNAVVVNYNEGYGDTAADIPEGIIAAVYLLIKHLYDNRDNVVIGSQVNTMPLGIEYLLNQYRLWQY